ncbi:MAG: hypothetical protein ACXVI6_01470, partial [Candidatus Aminicenantales bacterium]
IEASFVTPVQLGHRAVLGPELAHMFLTRLAQVLELELVGRRDVNRQVGNADLLRGQHSVLSGLDNARSIRWPGS